MNESLDFVLSTIKAEDCSIGSSESSLLDGLYKRGVGGDEMRAAIDFLVNEDYIKDAKINYRSYRLTYKGEMCLKSGGFTAQKQLEDESLSNLRDTLYYTKASFDLNKKVYIVAWIAVVISVIAIIISIVL